MMEGKDNSLSEDDEVVLEDALLDITADLLTTTEGEDFLDRLFALDAGQWMTTAELCPNDSSIHQRLLAAEQLGGGRLDVTWLAYPVSQYGMGYCLIIFYFEALHWSTTPIYNRSLFLRKRDNS